MAKIREALRRAKTIHAQPPERVPAPRPYQPVEAPFRTDVEEEVSFIEVGGRETPMEASPLVLASAPKTARGNQLVEPAQPNNFGKHREMPAPAAEVRLTGVAFRPFPREFPRLRPIPERFALELVALHQPDHPISEQYRALVKNVERQLPAGRSQALLFTSPTPQTDATAMLLNLAITHARQDATRNIVVDANLRRPTLAERLGLPVAPGLGEVLDGTLSLPRAIQESSQLNLYALTAGKTAQHNTPLVAGEAMRAVLCDLRARFDWILVNAPSWDGRPEVISLGFACDAVYLVLPEADAETGAVEELSELILQQGGCLQGYFLTG